MFAGLPGTGIGGMFYILLALFMPVCELYRMIRRHSSGKIWAFIAVQVGLVAGMWGGIWGEFWLRNKLLLWGHQVAVRTGWQQTFNQAKQFTLVAPYAALLSLALVVVSFFALKLIVGLGKKPHPGDAILHREAA
jgi:hypothetical protein